MTAKYRKRMRSMQSCRHDTMTRTVHAGIGRSVCDTCGHVQIEFSKSNLPEDQAQPTAAVS